MRALAALCMFLVLAAPAAWAAERVVMPGPGELARAVAEAQPGDALILAPGRHDGPVEIALPLTLDGQGRATIDGGGKGSVFQGKAGSLERRQQAYDLIRRRLG